MPAPRRRASSRRPMDERHRTDVEAAGRLIGQDQARVELEHAAEEQLLDVAAGEQADRAGPGPRSARRRSLIRARACCGQPAAAQEAQALECRAAAGLEHQVLGRSAARRPRPRPGGPPVCARRRPRPPRPHRRPAMGRPPERTSPPRARTMPGEQAGQRPLAVARDAGDADDLVRVDGEARLPPRPSRRGRAGRHRAAPGRGRRVFARRAAAG